jgi:hypothetical protein
MPNLRYRQRQRTHRQYHVRRQYQYSHTSSQRTKRAMHRSKHSRPKRTSISSSRLARQSSLEQNLTIDKDSVDESM